MRGNDLFNRLIAGLALIFGFGNPSDNLINTIAVFIPPILAVLTTLVIFFIGKTVFNPTFGLVAAGLYAIMPGESMGRALLGMVDQHIFEVLLTCMIALFFILSIKNERKLKQGIIWASLTGFALWLYFWNWAGASLFAFIICLYLVVLSIINRIKKQRSNKLLIMGAIVLAIPTILIVFKIGFSPDINAMALMPLSLIVPALLFALSFLPYRINIAYYLLILASPVIILFAIHYGIDLYFLNNPQAVSQGILAFVHYSSGMAVDTLAQIILLSKIFGHNVATTTAEEMPLLYWRGSFSLSPAWGNFGFCFPLFFVGLYFTIRKAIKGKGRDILFVAIWSIVILFLTLALRRFAYYFAVNVALMTTFTLWLLWELVPKDAWKRTLIILTLIVAIVLPFIPSMKNDMSQPSPANITSGWQEAMVWLKTNTAEPFNDSNYYYADYATLKEPDYTVLAWWDYGYWIMREGRRVPVNNPGGGYRNLVAQFFISTDTDEAKEILQKDRVRYIIIDYSSVIGKFYAMPAITQKGKTTDDFFGVYQVKQKNGELGLNPFFYPEYYQTMIVRLYNFDAQKVEFPGTLAIEYDDNGKVVALQDFTSLKEANDYVATLKGNFAVGGTDPFVSPVDLEPLEDYKLVFQSKEWTMGQPSVKIFEVIPQQ
jgi:oligosaccharyl transferase (archaeosortase A-associated)